MTTKTPHIVSKDIFVALNYVQLNSGIGDIIEAHTIKTIPWGDEASPLNKLTTFELASYLFEGYEMKKEPDFLKPLRYALDHKSIGHVISEMYACTKFAEDTVLFDLWQKAERSISEIETHLRKKYKLDV